MSEASGIIHSMSELEITYESSQEIGWEFAPTGAGSGRLFSRGDDLVTAVQVGNSEHDLQLDQVIEAHGEPAYVEAYDCREGMCETLLIFTDLGMLLKVFMKDYGEGDAHQVNIRANTTVDWATFIPKGLQSFQAIPDYQGYPLWEWKGYGDYP